MEIVWLEKLIELVKEIYLTNDEDEIIYPIDEFTYNEYDID